MQIVNSNLYGIDNFWLYVSNLQVGYVKIRCSCLVCTKKKNVYRKTSNGKAIARRKRYADTFVKDVEC